jgi:cellulose synthase/poly-beta-1,6-N-acetylglucosamine synthase-like glycosyltransferase
MNTPATPSVPSVSVVIPCFNAEHFISETLESALAQTSPAHEIIVVDDGSTDNSARIIESFGQPVRLVSQSNTDAAYHERMGIKIASQATMPILLSGVKHAELSYWERDLKRFKYLRSELLEVWPEDVRKPIELTRFIYPRLY